MNNYQGFLHWCNTHNRSLIQFEKTSKNQIEYCEFIRSNYKSASMIGNISETQHFYDNVKKGKNTNLNYILSNLRMSICELG
jgi:hypothetical protein